MRNIRAVLFGGAALWAQPSLASDALKFGPIPEWVLPQTVPTKPSKLSDAPVAVLLSDTQVHLDPGKIATFTETAVKVQTADGLSAGNVSIPWAPSTDTITINKLHILRDGKIIDVLGKGQTFTVLRRETDLDAATLDGALTASIQPEGLQVGDIIDLATTDEHVDPVLKNHVEGGYGAWNTVPIESAHVRISWPSTMVLTFRHSGDLPQPQTFLSGSRKILELSEHATEPVLMPKGAPARFQVGRLGEISDFKSWSDVADLMMPLYQDTAVIPKSGPLRDEVETIRKQAHSPKEKAEQVLELVESRVRYVALEMGSGGLIPATAETTWSRRFGDCKGKTVLVLAMLHDLGIDAEPVLVQAHLGDILPDRLPMLAYFNHVIVRAHIGGKTYWLDPTRLGDTDLDRIPVPDFKWGLPLVEHASLVAIEPPISAVPLSDYRIAIDATDGIFAPAPTTAEMVMRGDTALGMKFVIAKLTSAQEQDQLRQFWKDKLDFFDPKNVSANFDDATGEMHFKAAGTSAIDWREGWFELPNSSIGYDPDFDRPAGPLHDAPFSTDYPNYDHSVVTIHLPSGFLADQKMPPATVDEKLAGIEYIRRITVAGDSMSVETSGRAVLSEVPYKDALAAAPRLKALNSEDVSLRVPDGYAASDKDLAQLELNKPSSAWQFFQRAGAYLMRDRTDDGLADLTAGLALDPKNTWALNKRAWVYAFTHDNSDAQKDLAAADALDPGNLVTLSTRGFLAEQKGDFATALDDFSKVLQRDPKNEFALTQRGSILAAKGKRNEAMRDLNTVVAAKPNNAKALSERAFSELQTHDLDAADKDVNAALAIEPTNLQALNAVAMIAQARGDYQGAVRAFSKTIEVLAAHPNPRSIGLALTQRAEAYRHLSELDKALADTEAAIKGGYREANVRLVRANIFMAQGKRDDVAREADLLVGENSKSDFAYVVAAKTYAAIGRNDDAVKALNHALSIQPAAYVYLNLEDVRPVKDHKDRLADVENALKLEPDNSFALAARAYLLELDKDYPKALAAYDAAIDASPADENLKIDKAVALYKAGKAADARKILSAENAQAKTASDFGYICSAEARAGIFLDEAIKDCREALRLSPASGRYSLGLALLRHGELDSAVAAFSDVLKKDASSADGHFARAIAYALKGDVNQANSDRNEALKLDRYVADKFAEYGLTFTPSSANQSRQSNKVFGATN